MENQLDSSVMYFAVLFMTWEINGDDKDLRHPYSNLGLFKHQNVNDTPHEIYMWKWARLSPDCSKIMQTTTQASKSNDIDFIIVLSPNVIYVTNIEKNQQHVICINQIG